MSNTRLLSIVFFLLLPALAFAAVTVEEDVKTSTVFIANYNADDDFVGWGSGFFVDEGIVVTNKHVIQAGTWYRVFATGVNDSVDTECKRDITKSDVKINLDDDVAYMRVYLPCDHGTMLFADDAEVDDEVWVIGYPFRGSLEASLDLSITTGVVTAKAEGGWVMTDAHMDQGNSGGPVVNGTGVIGVAVAKGVDVDGNYLTGYFIPSSVILHGLLYANDPRFGYTPQIASSRRNSSRSSSVSSSASSLRSSVSSRRISSSRSSSRSSVPSVVAVEFPDVPFTRAGYDAILSLRARGVIDGYPDGTFRPDAGINRAEFIKILVGGFEQGDIKGETHCFSDVASEWFAPYVCAAKRLGWIDGYPDGSFRPAQLVNRAEAMKIVIEAFGKNIKEAQDLPRDVPSDSWYAPYVAAGVTVGIFDGRYFYPERDLTREHAAMWIEGAE